MTVFKAYDVRGVVPAELDARLAYRIGVATGRFLGGGRIVVGRDARLHSPELSAALMHGLADGDAEIVEIGLVTTPMVYFAVEHLGARGGVMVTASHNPAEYNGFKICRQHAIPIGEASGLREIEALADAAGVPAGYECRPDGVVLESVLSSYVDHVLALAPAGPPHGLKVAIDCGNGMSAVSLTPILERWGREAGLQVERLYFEPDGTFPNHEADPLRPRNLQDLQQAVRRIGADLGVAFDGDGDRAVFVDDTGEPISSDLTTALLARHALQSAPGGRVLYDLRSSRVVAEEIERAGGVAEMCRVGHSFVKAEMRESGAIFAGELSGHFYFRFSPTLIADDGTAAFVSVLTVLADAQGARFSDLVRPLRRYHASGEINRRVSNIEALLTEIADRHRAAAIVSRLDGLYVRYADWWFNVRPSNTEPVLRLNLEADTREQMERERDALLDLITGG